MPPVLRKLTVALPPKPSQAESDAAVQLIAAVQASYGGSKRAVRRRTPRRRRDHSAARRHPWSGRSSSKRARTKDFHCRATQAFPHCSISGPGDELKNQTRLLTDDSLNLALTRKAVAGPLETKQKIVGDNTTLKEMGMGEFTSIGLWPEVGIDLDQSKFGHAAAGGAGTSDRLVHAPCA